MQEGTVDGKIERIEKAASYASLSRVVCAPCWGCAGISAIDYLEHKIGARRRLVKPHLDAKVSAARVCGLWSSRALMTSIRNHVPITVDPPPAANLISDLKMHES